MLRIGYRTPLGFEIRPADRIIRELPPSLTAYRLRFPSAPPRLGAYYRAEYGLGEKKPSRFGSRVYAARFPRGEDENQS